MLYPPPRGWDLCLMGFIYMGFALSQVTWEALTLRWSIMGDMMGNVYEALARASTADM